VTARAVIAECGADLSVFPSEKQFTSWLGLVRTNDQSSGKILNRRTHNAVNRAATAFCNAATPLVRSQSYFRGAISPAAHSSGGAESHHRLRKKVSRTANPIAHKRNSIFISINYPTEPPEGFW